MKSKHLLCLFKKDALVKDIGDCFSWVKHNQLKVSNYTKSKPVFDHVSYVFSITMNFNQSSPAIVIWNKFVRVTFLVEKRLLGGRRGPLSLAEKCNSLRWQRELQKWFAVSHHVQISVIRHQHVLPEKLTFQRIQSTSAMPHEIASGNVLKIIFTFISCCMDFGLSRTFKGQDLKKMEVWIVLVLLERESRKGHYSRTKYASLHPSPSPPCHSMQNYASIWLSNNFVPVFLSCVDILLLNNFKHFAHAIHTSFFYT